VRGQVVSVTTSPLGTAFINFGGAYPNQKFAGFIAAGSKVAPNQRLTMIQGKIISITGTIRTSGREARDRSRVGGSDQRFGFSHGTVRPIPSRKLPPPVPLSKPLIIASVANARLPRVAEASPGYPMHSSFRRFCRPRNGESKFL
jgi:hypothetical protein